MFSQKSGRRSLAPYCTPGPSCYPHPPTFLLVVTGTRDIQGFREVGTYASSTSKASGPQDIYRLLLSLAPNHTPCEFSTGKSQEPKGHPGAYMAQTDGSDAAS